MDHLTALRSFETSETIYPTTLRDTSDDRRRDNPTPRNFILKHVIDLCRLDLDVIFKLLDICYS